MLSWKKALRSGPPSIHTVQPAGHLSTSKARRRARSARNNHSFTVHREFPPLRGRGLLRRHQQLRLSQIQQEGEERIREEGKERARGKFHFCCGAHGRGRAPPSLTPSLPSQSLAKIINHGDRVCLLFGKMGSEGRSARSCSGEEKKCPSYGKVVGCGRLAAVSGDRVSFCE